VIGQSILEIPESIIPGTAKNDIPVDFLALGNLHKFFEKTAKSQYGSVKAEIVVN
jgi:hypothetical protein